jgi:hypothetical protein
MRGQGFQSGATLSHQATVGQGFQSGTFQRDAKPLVLDIRWSVDRLVPVLPSFAWSTLFLPGHVLPYVRIIMVPMCVSLVALLFQTEMGWILVLESMLLGARGLLQPHPILPGTECHRLPRPWRW